MKRIALFLGILVMFVSLHAQGSHVCRFKMYRNLPTINDTPALFYIHYIPRYVRPTAIKDSWQIRENNKGGTWGHSAANPGLSIAYPDPGNYEPEFSWRTGDTSICVFEFELDSLVATHKGYYSAIAIRLDNAYNSDSARGCTLRAIPKPDTVARTGTRRYPIVRWQKPPYDTSVIPQGKLIFNPIVGYSIWRSTVANGPTGPWTRLPPRPDGGGYQPYDTTRYEDTTALNDSTYYYTIRLVYYPVRVFGGTDTTRIESRLSENSVLVAVGVEETESPGPGARQVDFRVMPNPTRRNVRFQISGLHDGRASLSIYNSSGRLMRSGEPTAGVVWDRRDSEGVIVPNGVYFISLRTKDRIITKKLILE